MKVEVVKIYSDTTQNDELISVGTVLDVSTDRGNQLIKAGVAKEIKENKSKK